MSRSEASYSNALDVNDLLPEEVMENAQLFRGVDLKKGSFLWLLPKVISPNTLQKKRFSPIEGLIFLQQSPAIEQLTSFFKYRRGGTLYVRGPAGVGKSYAILYLMLSLRKSSKTERILYINNPNQLESTWTFYCARELIYTMAKDIAIWEKNPEKFIFSRNKNEPVKDAFLRHSRSLINQINHTPLHEILQKYYEYCSNNGLNLILFVDQYTPFLRSHKVSEKTKERMQELTECCHMRLFGTSDNSNQGSSSEGEELFIESKFRVDQAILYLSQKLKASAGNLMLPRSIKRGSLSSEETIYQSYPNLRRLADSTDFLPYELEVFTKTAIANPGKTFNEVFEAYYKARYLEISFMHEDWIKENCPFIPNIHGALTKLVFKMSLGIRDPASVLAFMTSPDPNLFYRDTKVQPQVVRFSSKVVEAVLYQKYLEPSNLRQYLDSRNRQDPIMQCLEENLEVLQMMLRNYQERDGLRGNFFEKYFGFLMETASQKGQSVMQKRNQSQVYNLSFQDHQLKSQAINFAEIQMLERFDDSQLEEEIQLCLSKQSFMAFIPNSPHYDHVDFVLVDGRQGAKIYLIQATINIIKHKRSDQLLNKEIQKFKTAKNQTSINQQVKENSPISNVLFNIMKKDPKVEKHFIWVGMAYNSTEGKWFEKSKDVWKKGIIDDDSKIALVIENKNFFHQIPFSDS